jgi:hypothetical protein
MIAFEISVNGRRLCTAGVDAAYGVLTAMLTWTRRDLRQLPDQASKDLAAEELRLTVAGHVSHGRYSHENLQWPGGDVRPGDAITIRIVETEAADAPQTRQRSQPPLSESTRTH